MTQNPRHVPAQAVTVELDAPARLLLAAQGALPFLPREARERLAPLFTLEAMAVLAGTVLAVAISHALGAGIVVDVLLGAAAFAVVGADTLEVGRRLVEFHRLAMEARHPQDFEAAGRELAAAVVIVGVDVVVALLARRATGRMPKIKRPDAGTLRAGWMPYVRNIRFSVPRDKGMLWSKLGDWKAAHRLARQRKLVTLEAQLETQGFFPLYESQFGSWEQVQAAKLEAVTEEIWRTLSRRYAASLEGKVTALVHQRKLAGSLATKEPFIVDELDEIAELMRHNAKVTAVEMIDVESGTTWQMLRADVLRAAGRSH